MSTTALAFDKAVLIPGLAWFKEKAPTIPISRNCHVLMLAIAGQEGGWQYRVQHNNGPAHGFWQFEKMGGVNGVLTHPATQNTARVLCANYNIPATADAVWKVLATQNGDNLAAAFARLLLWTDPKGIPTPSDEDATWLYYLRNWRPGSPRPQDWHANITQANAAVVP